MVEIEGKLDEKKGGDEDVAMDKLEVVYFVGGKFETASEKDPSM